MRDRIIDPDHHVWIPPVRSPRGETMPTPTAFGVHDHPAIRLAGELLYRRRDSSHDAAQDDADLLGDAGAMVLLTNPELFVTRELPVRVNLAGVGRGQTIVVQPASPDDSAAPDPDAWPRISVALDLDATQAASAFVKVIDSYAA